MKDQWKKNYSSPENYSFYLQLHSFKFGAIEKVYRADNELLLLKPLGFDYKLARSVSLDFTKFYEHKTIGGEHVFLDAVKLKRMGMFLKKLRNLRTVTVIFVEEYPLRSMKYFFYALSRLKGAKNIKIEISSSNKSSTYYTWRQAAFETWIKPLKYLNRLFLADPFANLRLIKNISHAKKLRVFNLWLNNPDVMDYDDKLNVIRFTLNRHIRLEKLFFEVICVELNNKSTEFIKRVLAASDYLKSLSIIIDGACKLLERFKNKKCPLLEELNIFRDRKSGDYDILKLVDLLNGTPNLKSLNLIMENKDLTDDAFKYFGRGINKLTSLRNFSLTANKCDKISDDAIEYLSQALKTQKELTSFSLNLKSDWISDKVAYYIQQVIEDKKHMNRLAIDLGGCKSISDRAWESLNGHLDIVENFSIDFTLCEKINDGLPRYLVNALENSKKLKTIEICIGDLNNLRDGTLLNFRKLCQSVENITSVLLHIDAAKFTEFGFEALSKGLDALKLLEVLSLKLPSINDRKMKYLSEGLGGLSKLKKVSLSFLESHELSDTGIVYLRDLIADVKLFEDLTLIWRLETKFNATAMNDLRSTLVNKKLLKEFALQVRLSNLSKEHGLFLERSFREIKIWRKIQIQISV